MRKWNRRRAEIHRHSQQFIHLTFPMIHAFYTPRLVRDSDNNNASIGIGKCANMTREISRSNIDTLTIESLRFFLRKQFLYMHYASIGHILRPVDI